MPPFAAPLKVSASSKADPQATSSSSGLAPTKVEDISSPHELTAFVENLLTQIETNFESMSTQILDRMNAMTTRVDSLEAAIQDLIQSDQIQPQTPQTPGTK